MISMRLYRNYPILEEYIHNHIAFTMYGRYPRFSSSADDDVSLIVRSLEWSRAHKRRW